MFVNFLCRHDLRPGPIDARQKAPGLPLFFTDAGLDVGGEAPAVDEPGYLYARLTMAVNRHSNGFLT